MTPPIVVAVAGLLLALPSLASAQATQTQEPPRSAHTSQSQSAVGTASGVFIDADGNEIGVAALTQTPNGVLIRAEARGVPRGEHGFHIHEIGRCDPGSGFDSAGGHYAGNMKHGFKVAGGPHPGDMPNVHVQADGVMMVEVVNARVSLRGAEHPLLDKDGSALVVHSGPDDYETQPSGAAGDRIACAVISAMR